MTRGSVITHRTHRNDPTRLTNAERADKYLRDVFPDRDKLVREFRAAGRAAVARYKRRHADPFVKNWKADVKVGMRALLRRRKAKR